MNDKVMIIKFMFFGIDIGNQAIILSLIFILVIFANMAQMMYFYFLAARKKERCIKINGA